MGPPQQNQETIRMRREKIVAQLESELAAAQAATADSTPPYDNGDIDPSFFEGYWRGRIFGLQQALTLLHGKEQNFEPRS